MKVFKWLKEKWEIAITAMAVAIAALMVSLRIRAQKQNFKNAKDTFNAELEANKKAEEELVEGITNISKEKDDALEGLETSSKEEEELLKEKKEEFAKEASESSELAKDIANLIGAEFVEVEDE